MHIQNQFCALVIMIVLLFLFLRQQRVGLHREWIFLRALLVIIVSVTLDIVSIVAIYYRDSIPGLLLDFVCKTYLVSLVWVGSQAFAYVLADILSEKKYRKCFQLVMLFELVESVILYFLPIHYYADENAIYTYGVGVYVTYFFALTYFLSTMFIIVRYWHHLESKRKYAVIAWMVLWLAAAIIQFINNQMLLVGFACGLGMLILYCTLENPENKIDHKSGCFHHHVLAEYLDQCYGRGVSQSIMYLSFLNEQLKNLDAENMENCIHKLIEWFRLNTEAKVFKSVDQELVAVFPNMSVMSEVFAQVQEKFYYNQFYRVEGEENNSVDAKEHEDFPETLFILIPDTLIAQNTEEIFMLHRFVHLENRNVSNSMVYYVNANILAEIQRKSTVMAEIVNALDEDRVEVFFQPIYSVRDDAFTSAEALVRIRGKDGTILSPGIFIPVAEESGLISRLGERVFEKVCNFLQAHDPKELGINYLEVNLSVIQCEQRNLADRYLRIMRKYGTESWYINLEITESGEVSFKNTLLRNMNQLISHGVSFSLDDFGNGQSNLNYMIEMPVSVMKLDMSMTQAYFKDLKAQFVVNSCIELAHKLDLFVVAEGIETREQLDEMIAKKVDYIQGFYFSKPLPVDEYLAFLEAHRGKVVSG